MKSGFLRGMRVPSYDVVPFWRENENNKRIKMVAI